jgi:hypothetical protein
MAVTNQALPGDYQLLNYRIDRQISRGGFSIVYRAYDETSAPVAIKEYLPASLVLRTAGDIVPRQLGRKSDLVSLRDEVLFRGRPRTRQDQSPQRRSRAQFFPRQRNGVHGDALRAWPHASATDPDAPGPDIGATGAPGVHAAA